MKHGCFNEKIDNIASGWLIGENALARSEVTINIGEKTERVRSSMRSATDLRLSELVNDQPRG